MKYIILYMVMIALLLLFFKWWDYTPQIPPPQDPEKSMADTILIDHSRLQDTMPANEPDTIMDASGWVSVRPGHGNVPLYQVDSNQYYQGRILDSSWTDDEGHQYRARLGRIVACLPRGFPSWVIWDTPGYSLTKWGRRRGGK